MYHWDGSHRALLARGGCDGAAQQNVSELSSPPRRAAFVARWVRRTLFIMHTSPTALP